MSDTPQSISTRLYNSVKAGLIRGLRAFVWLLKILAPVSLITTLIEASGWLSYLEGFLRPALKFISLPPEAVLPLVSGLFVGLYGGIAAMAVLPFSTGQMTLIAVFLLLAHNLIQEGIVQAKSGTSILKISVIRLLAALIAVWITAQFVDSETSMAVVSHQSGAPADSLLLISQHWLISMALLSVKMLLIVCGIMIAIEVMQQFNAQQYLVAIFTPLLRTMGLNREVGLLWVTAVLFGVAYGGAVLVEEVRKQDLPEEAVEKLHLSIGINHAMIEDPALFLPFGIHPLWLWGPRLVAAIAVVYLASAWFAVKRRFLK
jgi:hypothetical protein